MAEAVARLRTKRQPQQQTQTGVEAIVSDAERTMKDLRKCQNMRNALINRIRSDRGPARTERKRGKEDGEDDKEEDVMDALLQAAINVASLPSVKPMGYSSKSLFQIIKQARNDDADSVDHAAMALKVLKFRKYSCRAHLHKLRENAAAGH